MHVSQIIIQHIYNYIIVYHTFIKIPSIILTKDVIILNIVLKT